MKAFVALLATLLAACSAQDRTPVKDGGGFLRTPICEDVGEPRSASGLPALARGNIGTQIGATNLGARGLVGRGGRKRRQAQEKFNATKTPFQWYTNTQATNGDDCNADQKTKKLNRGPVIVPLGTYNVCVKFDKANRWFYTKGSNAPCSPDNRCCEWFPPRQCTRRDKVVLWFELPAGSPSCEQAFANGANPELGVEYLQNKKVGQKATICIYINPDRDDNEVAQFDTVPVTTSFCGEGCCLFDRD